MKKKGFTLIELLAVIVILAVIALIATPVILGVIETARKGAFKSTINGIVNSSEVYRAKEELTSPVIDCRYFSFSNDVTEITPEYDENGSVVKTYYPLKDLSLKGKTPTQGFVKVCKDSIEIQASDGNYTGIYDGKNTQVITGDLASNDVNAPIITQISTSKTSASITAVVTAKSASETGIISKYYYKIGENGSYVESDSNVHKFNNLTPGTEYKIYVKVENGSGLQTEYKNPENSEENYIIVSTNAFESIKINVEDETKWSTSKKVTLEGSESMQYKVVEDGADADTIEWANYSESSNIVVNKNNTLVLAQYPSIENSVNSKTVVNIDTTAPTLEMTSIGKTTNSLTLNYNAVDTESDIKNVVCEFKIGDDVRTVTGTSTSCTITGLSKGTVQYKVTATNNAGIATTVPETGYSSAEIIDIDDYFNGDLQPITVVTDPEGVAAGSYVTSATATIPNASNDVANAVYYVRTTRATVSNKEAVATCQYDGNANSFTCTDLETATTSLSADTWYKFNNAPTFTYNVPATELAYIDAAISDGVNTSSWLNATIHQIFYKAADISYTNAAVSSVTNVEEALDYLYDNLK